MMQHRRDQRYLVQCPVTFTLDEEEGHGAIYNLSRQGCALESETTAGEGESISLRVTVPGQALPVVVELGRVRWATRRECGVEFVMLTPDHRARLD